MPVQFLNYEYKYNKGGKPVFAPNDRGRRIGNDLKRQIETTVTFDPFYYHYRDGGHVAALHAHRQHRYFARLDIARFFYSISKSRVQRALQNYGILRARHYAKWSCVKNPFGEPAYSLPYGFVQSPILATLVVQESALGACLREINPAITSSMYVDDISISSDNREALQEAYEAIVVALEIANFEISDLKSRRPAPSIDLFNCDLSHGQTAVRQVRVAEFGAVQRSKPSQDAFDAYCEIVGEGNW